MSGLLGLYQRSLDDKGRLVLPPELRNRLDPQVVMSRWYDNSLALFRESEYSRFAANLHRLGSSDARIRTARREIFGGACVVGIDGQGRMSVPERLLEGVLMDREKDRDLILLGDWNKVLIHSGLRYADMARRDQVNLDEALSSVEMSAREASPLDDNEEGIVAVSD